MKVKTNRVISFAGPTGAGKTEVSRQLAKIMGIELQGLICQSTWKDTLFPLIGAPPGYIGFDQRLNDRSGK